MDAGRGVLGDVREPVGVARHVHQPRPGVVGDAVAREVGVRAGHAVPGDRAEHDPRVDLAQVLEAEAAFGERPGAHRLDDDICVAHEVPEDVLGLLRAQVEGDRLLPTVDVPVQQRAALDDRPGHLADVVALGGLDLDDVCAQVRQVQTDGCRSEQGELDDAQPGEWTPRCVVRAGVGHGVPPGSDGSSDRRPVGAGPCSCVDPPSQRAVVEQCVRECAPAGQDL